MSFLLGTNMNILLLFSEEWNGESGEGGLIVPLSKNNNNMDPGFLFLDEEEGGAISWPPNISCLLVLKPK